jgi:hypothetical protein
LLFHTQQSVSILTVLYVNWILFKATKGGLKDSYSKVGAFLQVVFDLVSVLGRNLSRCDKESVLLVSY